MIYYILYIKYYILDIIYYIESISSYEADCLSPFIDPIAHRRSVGRSDVLIMGPDYLNYSGSSSEFP